MPPSAINQTRSQTLQLLKDYQNDPSPALQEQIVRLNIDLVHKIVLGSTNAQHGNYEDFVQAGATGLVQAVQGFNINSKQTFKTFATPYVRHQIETYAQKAIAPNPPQPAQKSPKVEQPMPAIAIDDSPSGSLKIETLKFLELYRSQPSKKIRNHLVKLNIGLVRKEAHHWANQCTEHYEDLMQVGAMGLIRAIERFDVSRGHAFSSFAVPYIRGEIQHYLRDKSPTLRMPRRWLVLYNQGCKVLRNLRMELKREPLDREVADALGIKVMEWQEIKLACQNRSPLSLDAPMQEDENGSTLGDLVPDANYRSFQLAQEDSLRIHQAMSQLEDRTREVVEFVFLKEFTHREVAEILGISAVTVSRQVKKGITILKQIMATPLD
jgi:RNA polymerase sigma-B factor